MKTVVVFAFVIAMAYGATLMDNPCPNNCICLNINEIKCHSLIFLKEILPKQLLNIKKLTINNSSIKLIEPKLKYLKNLEYLDLSLNNIELINEFPYLPKLKLLNISYNKINDIKLNQLPKNLETLDLSNNLIVYIPNDYKYLKLKNLYLQNNKLDCDCYLLSIYENIIKNNINLGKNLTCYYPNEFNGRKLNTINCKQINDYLLNSMLGDDIGSGSIDNNDNNKIEDENEYIPALKNVIIVPDDEEKIDEIVDEGSGSGFITTDEIIPPKACHFNCSTAKPVGLNDEKNASPLPPLKEQLEILGSDISEPIFGFGTTTPPKTTTTTTTTTTRTTTKTTETLREVNEPNFVEDKNKQVEILPTNNTIRIEMERASIASKESNPYFIFIVLGLVTALVVFLTIYYIISKKKRNRIRRNKPIDNGYNGEELKPLSKTNGKNNKSSSIEIKLNPQQQQQKQEENENSEQQHLLTNNQNGIHNNDDNNMDNVELRNKKDLLTPQLERVTIKVGEIPDSIPKTPLFVHRQVNSDGEITTTVDEQQLK